MPLFMDVHNVDGIDPDALASAHERDLEIQERYGVSYQRYWYSQPDGKVFCLVDAPDPDADHRPRTSSLPVSAIAITSSTSSSLTPSSTRVSRKWPMKTW